MKWEEVINISSESFLDNTERLKVFGGWIVRNVFDNSNDQENFDMDTRVCMVFIPDPNHDWKL
jgi:hypothetical protein